LPAERNCAARPLFAQRSGLRAAQGARRARRDGGYAAGVYGERGVRLFCCNNGLRVIFDSDPRRPLRIAFRTVLIGLKRPHRIEMTPMRDGVKPYTVIILPRGCQGRPDRPDTHAEQHRETRLEHRSVPGGAAAGGRHRVRPRPDQEHASEMSGGRRRLTGCPLTIAVLVRAFSWNRSRIESSSSIVRM